MKARLVKFGEIEVEGKRYTHDVVIDGGKVRKRKKGRSKQFGLVAEEVAAVNPDLVVRDENGEVYTVRYDAVNAMLLNEFLKEHSTVEELKKEIATLTTTVKEQAAQVQKVSAQLEASKPAPQAVVNNP